MVEAMVCSIFLKCWALLLAVVGLGEKVHLQSVVERSVALKRDMTGEEVLAILGEPSEKWKARSGFLFFGGGPPQWIYGTTIDLGMIVIPEWPVPNPLPIKLRLFSSDPGDLVLDWTEDGKLMGVKQPKLKVPETLREVYEPVFALSEFVDRCIFVNDHDSTDH